MLNHVAHALVSAIIALAFLIPLINHNDNQKLASLSVLGLGASGIQLIYHLGLVLAISFKSYTHELPAGHVARNLLTALMLSTSVALLGALAKAGAARPFSKELGSKPTDATLLEQWDLDNSRNMNLIGVILVFVMRFLDLGIDFTHEDAGKESQQERDIKGKFAQLIAVECADKPDDGEGVFGTKGVLNARILMVHLLLAAAGVFSIVVTLGRTPDLGNWTIGSDGLNDVAQNMAAAMFLIIIHFGLYPVALLINMVDFLQKTCIYAHCGKPDNCSTLESFNRMPVLRSIVAAAVLSCLSYVIGSTLGSDLHIQNILLVWVAYLAADAVGRNVV